MAARRLRNRRKRASKGRLIRISDLVYDALNKNRMRMSWDCLLRRMLGLPDRYGNEQTLIEGLLEQNTGRFFLKRPDVRWSALEEDAYEVAILAAAKARTKRVRAPLRMRELP